MKVRNDFITNSSSSSFIIEKGIVSYGRLLKILLKIAQKEQEKYTSGEKSDITWDDVEKDRVTYRYNITEATREIPYWKHSHDGNSEDEIFTDHFIIDNDGGSKYDWDVIEQVLGKQNIPWCRGYCE